MATIRFLDDRRHERDERKLVERMLAGDGGAFQTFADRYAPRVYRFALRRLRGDPDVTQEVVQATLVKAMSKLSGFRGESQLTTWLCACCRNEIAGHFRRLGRSSRAVELEAADEAGAFVGSNLEPSGPEALAIRREEAGHVHEVLDALPSHYAQALEWKYVDRLPVREIADRLGVGPKAAESILTRAREAFRRTFRHPTSAATAGRSAVDQQMAPEPRGAADMARE